jgi:hypothetical protein
MHENGKYCLLKPIFAASISAREKKRETYENGMCACRRVSLSPALYSDSNLMRYRSQCIIPSIYHKNSSQQLDLGVYLYNADTIRDIIGLNHMCLMYRKLVILPLILQLPNIVLDIKSMRYREFSIITRRGSDVGDLIF